MILLLLMLGFCLYGSRMSMAKGTVPAYAVQTDKTQNAQTESKNEAGTVQSKRTDEDEFVSAVLYDEPEPPEEQQPQEYPVETMYTDEDHKHIAYGNISFDMDHSAYLTRVIEEEGRTAFVAQDFFYVSSEERMVWSEVTYSFSREPDLVITDYDRAMQYFDKISECRDFTVYRYPENAAKNNISALYTATMADGKTYCLADCKGEEGFYLIEASANVGILRWLTGCMVNQYKEYEYSAEEIECAGGRTARVESFFYPGEHRAEYRVTSDGANFTAKLQSRESEESAYARTLTMDIEITQETGQIKSQRLQWVCDGVEEVEEIYPDSRKMHFQDADRDGYLDFLPVIDVTVRESCQAVFVWDWESEEYVRVSVEDALFPDTVASHPQFYDGYMVQSTVVGFYEQRLERYRWEGHKLVFDDRIITRAVGAEDDVDPAMTMVYDKEQSEFVPMDNDALGKLCDDFRADRE